MTELEQVEIQIDVAKEMIAMRDAYMRLTKNKDFKKVVEDGYFKEEAARLVMARSNLNLNEAQREGVNKMIDGVGALANYFDLLCRRGNEMDVAIEDHEATREEILAEEIANG